MLNKYIRLPKLLSVTLIACMSLALHSCQDEDDPYTSILIGPWTLVDYYGQGTYYMDFYEFCPDGSGYAETWGEGSYNFWWNSYGGNNLQMTFNDGTTWNFYYNASARALSLQPYYDGSTEYLYKRGY